MSFNELSQYDRDEDKFFWEKAFKFIKKPNKYSEKEFVLALLDIKLYLIIDSDGNLYAEKDEENYKYIAGYTNRNIEDMNLNNHKIMDTNFEKLKHLILKNENKLDGIVLIGEENRIILNKKTIMDIENLLTGMTLIKTEGTKDPLEYIEPKKLPKNLVKNIINFASKKGNIKQINLYKARRRKEDDYHWLFLVDFTGIDMGLFPDLSKVIQQSMDKGDVFELIKVSEIDRNLMENYRTIIYK